MTEFGHCRSSTVATQQLHGAPPDTQPLRASLAQRPYEMAPALLQRHRVNNCVVTWVNAKNFLQVHEHRWNER